MGGRCSIGVAKERALGRLLKMVAFLGNRDSCFDARRLLAAGVDLPQVRETVPGETAAPSERQTQVSGRPR